MLSDKDMHDRMVKGWRGGKPDGTICGAGSTIRNSTNVIDWLPDVCSRFGIQSVCDAGAGDLHWIRRVKWDVDYKPYDLFPRHESITKLDITTEYMAESDAVLCRFVLNHLMDGDDYERIEMALERFRRTSRFLIATNFSGNPGSNRGFVRLDLRDFLGDPLDYVVDGHEPNCVLAIWEI